MPPKMMPFEEALTFFQTCLPTLVEKESVPLASALGKVLAEDIVSPINVPPAANSAMDGYALNIDQASEHADTKQTPFQVSQRIPAGHAPSPLVTGTVARIFTGAEIPLGANAVIMQEEVRVNSDDTISLLRLPSANENIRPKGQDVASGQSILHSGEHLNAMDIGLLASIGINRVTIFKPLQVGILTTGDELIAPGTPLQDGQIYNSNGPMLQGLLTQSGYQVIDVTHCLDDKAATESVLQNLANKVDIILSSGGVSVGEEDYVKDAIERNGTINLWKVAMKPGKPIVIAKVFNTPLIGLPGNPSSTLVTYHWLANAALRRASGQAIQRPKPIPVKASFSRNKTISRDEFLRVSIQNGQAKPHPQQSSGALLPACESDGYLHIPAGFEINQEDSYDFYPFSTF
ncbi:molybdopterin molybdenumtransferase MoeA [Marinomonas mediterranea]|uniref:molybdopterin molybdotransferase MoeA n=1 Tax=Marinomonas mediterranea TaxID=119864 RepID=UPI00234A2798|nr:molybdopterin molybdotransferase MoeA [Marinomonas mediterranea]WCN12571.1 molybdopterin molybdenumtransferase MoeA [Marinomonas mediterranea]